MRRILTIAAISTALLASTTLASAKHRYARTHYVAVQESFCPTDERYACQNVPSYSGKTYARSSGARPQRKERIVSHPAGCPETLFCGCGASVRVFGHPIRNLYLAENWGRFPSAAPAPGMAAYCNSCGIGGHGHVVIIEENLGGGNVLAYDANSGGHQTRIHEVSLSGYRVVNPRPGRVTEAPKAKEEANPIVVVSAPIKWSSSDSVVELEPYAAAWATFANVRPEAKLTTYEIKGVAPFDPLPISFSVYSEYVDPREPRAVDVIKASLASVPVGDARAEIARISPMFGHSPAMMNAFAEIESSHRCTLQDPKSSYRGLFQLGDDEKTKYGPKGANVFDCRDNTLAAANKFVTEAYLFQHAMNRIPTYEDLYCVHQQGIAGCLEHLARPERLAWKSMYAAEPERGAKWARLAICRNVPSDLKAMRRGCESITSGQFVTIWHKRVKDFVAAIDREKKDTVPMTVAVRAVPTESLLEAAPPAPPVDRSQDARAYLVKTAGLGGTMFRQGVDAVRGRIAKIGPIKALLEAIGSGNVEAEGKAVSLGRIHPQLAIRAAEAVRAARAAGLSKAGVFSCYRPPGYGVGGFSNKFQSCHTYGLACDFKGIQETAKEYATWTRVATAAGLYRPYRTGGEANHWQVVPDKFCDQLRGTVTASGPKDLEKMWAAADRMIDRVGKQKHRHVKVAAR